MPRKSDLDLKVELTAKIHQINISMEFYGKRLLAEEGLPGTTISVVSLMLVLLEAGDMTLTDLAKRLHIGRPTLTVTADRLEEKGWIRREQCLDDRRNVYLCLTRSGKRAARKMDRVRYDVIEHMCPGLDRACMSKVNNILDKVLQNLNARLPDRFPDPVITVRVVHR